MVKTYNNVNELTSDSVLIIEGSVLANNYINFKDTVFTISTVKVTNVLKDYSNIKVGDTINLLQTGGIETIKQNDNLSKSFNNPINWNFMKYRTGLHHKIKIFCDMSIKLIMVV